MESLLCERDRLVANNFSADFAAIVDQQNPTMTTANVVLAATAGLEEAHQRTTFVLQWFAERARLLERQRMVQLPKDVWRCPKDRVGDDVIPEGAILGLQDGDFEVPPRCGILWNQLGVVRKRGELPRMCLLKYIDRRNRIGIFDLTRVFEPP